MITRSKKFICNSAVALFLLVLFSGCAQTRANIKEGETVEQNSASVIQAINATSDGMQVVVQTNKPLSYTYYKTSDPPKVVIDLAQTEPGEVDKTIELNTGNIKRIEVAKHEFTGGFLSRIEIILANEENDFTVATDPVDKGKLLINFPQAAVAEKPGVVSKEDVKPRSPAMSEKPLTSQQAETHADNSNDKPLNVNETPATQQIQAENIVAQPAAPIVSDKQTVQNQSQSDATKSAEPVASKPAPVQPKLLHAVSANNEGIEISVNGGIGTYNAFKLTKPDRIVIDLPGVKSGIAAKSITINKFAVSQVRQGIYPDKIRVVLDAAKNTLPPYQVIKNEEGLKVIFIAAPVTPITTPRAESVKSAVIEKKVATNMNSSIEAIDFKIIDDISRIAIKTSGYCNAGKPVKVSGGLSLTIKNCQLPMKFQRMIDTSAFPSVVKMITPFQVKVKKGKNTRIVVKLRQSATSVLRQEGDTLYWEIKNPEEIKSAAIIPTQSKLTSEMPKSAASPPVEAEENIAQTIKIGSSHDIRPGSEPKYLEKKHYTGRRVSLEFSDADIRKILQLIAEVSNLNFIIGDDVSGTISIKLVNVPWDQALDVILDSKGLEKRQDGNIMYIKPKGKFKTEEQEEADARKERESRMQLKTTVFDINFADISEIANQFDKLKSERGTIAKDDRTNRVIVTDIEDRLVKMRNLLKELDMPERQVMIEARIVEATSTFTQSLGVQWGLQYSDPTASVLGMRQVSVGLGGIVTPPPTSGTFGSTGGNAAGISFGTLGSNVQLDLRLSAAATVGQVKVISSPKVVTLNNKAAKISQGQNIPYATTSAEGTKTEWVEAALTLEVTPHVAADGTISMKIKATNDTPGQPVGDSTTPPINKKEATTEVQVKSGETTVIGGIYTDSDSESDNGMPFLKDIPLLGWLFKSNSLSKTKTELLIFITPKIVVN